MNGKSKCKILKEIRRKIAAENNIDYITSECKFQGNCTGTCPRCEAELRYLEEELRKRQLAGKAIAVAGITAALLVGTAGCGASAAPAPMPGQISTTNSSSTISTTASSGNTETTAPEEPPLGGVPVLPDDLMGDPAPPEDELMGEDMPEDSYDMGEVP